MNGLRLTVGIEGDQAFSTQRSDLAEAPQESVKAARPRLMVAPPPEPELTDPLQELDDLGLSTADPVPIPLSEIGESELVRDSTGLAPLDLVLGGGLGVATVILLAASPGVGKSTLTFQMLDGLGQRCLYVTGEETQEAVGATARRIGVVSSRISVLPEWRLEKIFAHARALRVQTIAIDSIQKMTCADISSRAGSATQVKESTARLVHYAKTTKTTIWIIGHVTSDGDIAGPKTIEHDVDVVLELEAGPKFGGNERILRPLKNRHGATNVVGYFELTAQGFVAVDPDGWDEKL
jgi:DNA repair protein RadA/Sms